MTVRGKIVSSSHVGGLLVEFDSRPPGLGWDVRIEGGKSIGRVDSVIGSVNSGLIHVSLTGHMEPASAIGAPVVINPLSRSKPTQRSHNKTPRGRSKGNFTTRRRSERGKGGERTLPTWVCQKCRSLNSRTSKCIGCGSPRSSARQNPPSSDKGPGGRKPHTRNSRMGRSGPQKKRGRASSSKKVWNNARKRNRQNSGNRQSR